MSGKGLFTGSDGTVDGDLACIAAEWGDATAEVCRRFIFNPKELPSDRPRQQHWSICTGYHDGTVRAKNIAVPGVRFNPRFIGSINGD